MVEITYRQDPDMLGASRHPSDAAEALAWLDQGNRTFAALGADDEAAPLVIPADFGFGATRGEAPKQQPFGVVLGCADARVPIELVFGRAVNDLFVVRIAGSTIGADTIGSISYAIHHFPSVRIAVVLGHSHCGAVSAAVDAFITPSAFLDLAAALPLRSLLDRILTGVRAAAKALEEVHGPSVASASGYRAALADTAISLNTAYSAFLLRAELGHQMGTHAEVVYGVYDLATRRAGLPGSEDSSLGPPPADVEQFRKLAWGIAASQKTRQLLDI